MELYHLTFCREIMEMGSGSMKASLSVGASGQTIGVLSIPPTRLICCRCDMSCSAALRSLREND
jgi:hypothetical protein